MVNLIQQAGDLLPDIQVFKNARANQALENTIAHVRNRFENKNRQLKLATQTFRELRESGLDIKKPRSLSGLNDSKKRAKGVSKELKPELDANEITRLLNKLTPPNGRKSIWELLEDQFENFSDAISKVLLAENDEYCEKTSAAVANIPGNPQGQELVKKLENAANQIRANRRTIDLNDPFFSDSVLKEIIQIRQKWAEQYQIWEKNWPKHQAIAKQENPKIKKFFEDAATTGAPLSAFTPEVKERLTEGGGLDDYVIKKKSG
jgi:hypothetical protein